MRTTRSHLGVTLFGFASLVAVGCSNSIEPTPTSGAIQIAVSTVSSYVDIDPDGYSVSVDGGSAQSIGVNGIVTIGTLPMGMHAVNLDGLASNCSVHDLNPRSVSVTTDRSPVHVSFSVFCTGDDSEGWWDY